MTRLGVALLALTAAAWALTVQRMGGMDAQPGGDLGGAGWFAVSWLTMTAAMMLPAVAPAALAYARRARGAAPTALFVGGYLLPWIAFGLAGYAAVEGVRSPHPGFLAWDAAGRWLAAGAIVAAGLYQLTGCKDACLRRCRDRRALLREHRRPGRLGALRLGAEHGGACVGCCWALMAALFALGAMSLAWMALVTVLIVAERVLPRPARLGVAVVLVALGAAVALAPGAVPALHVPTDAAM